MKKNLFVLLALFSLLAVASYGQKAKPKFVKTGGDKPAVSLLANLLPASDAVATINIKRLINEVMPQVLSSKPETLAKINAKMAEFQTRTGIDLKMVERAAIGIGYKKVSDKETDFEPLMLLQGKFNADSMIGLLTKAANGKYREEKVQDAAGTKTVYIFSLKDEIEKHKPAATKEENGFEKLISRLMNSFSDEVAITGFGTDTLVVGKLNRVTMMLSPVKAPVNGALLAQINQKPGAIVSFVGNVPQGMSQFIKLDDDEIGKNLDSIRTLRGSLDYNDGKAALTVSAKTLKAGDAQKLEEMLSGLQMVGKGLLGASKGADKQLYARMLEKIVITRKLNEVTLNLQMPKTDMDALVGVLIKDK